MELSYTIDKMEKLYFDAINHCNIYSNSLESMNQIIQELSKYWKSDETDTYQEFYDNYLKTYPKLLQAKELMTKFCNQIEEKKNEYKENSNKIIDLFE